MPPPTTNLARRALFPLAILTVALSATLPFLPALHAPFSDFDDHGFLLEPDQWRGLGPRNLAWMFSTYIRGHYQPLTYVSYAIDYSLFGLNPAAFHATNILLHTAAAILLFLLTRRVLSLITPPTNPAAGPAPSFPTITAAVAASLWAAHPLRVESVAWITERRDVLSATLLLAATLTYIRHATCTTSRPSRGRWWLATLILLTLSLLSKAWGMTFFVIALLLDVYPLRRVPLSPRLWLTEPRSRAILREKLPLAALGLIAAALAAAAQSQRASHSLSDWPLQNRVFQIAYGLCYYIRQTLAPHKLSLLHELPSHLSPTDPAWLIPLLVTIAAAILLLISHRRITGLAVALTAYAVLASPILGAFQSGMQLVADRYAYIATIPLFILAAGAATRLGARLATRPAPRSRIPWLIPPIALAALALLTAGTFRQSALWQDDSRLWQASIDNGIDGPVLRNYYATHLEGRGQLADAESQYRASLRLNPGFSESWFGLASVLTKQQRFGDAEPALQQAVATAPDPTQPLMMLGILYIAHLNRPNDALSAFGAAVQVCEKLGNPTNTGRPYLLLASTLGQSGDEDAAIPYLKKAAQFPDARAEAQSLLHDLGR